MTYTVTAKANFIDGLQHVWYCESYEEARKLAQKKQLVHKRSDHSVKLYNNVTIRDEHGIKCSF